MKNIVKLLILSVFILLGNITFAQYFGGGTGTEDDPYQITTKEHFEYIIDELNDFDSTYWGNFSGIHFRVMNDIDEPITKRANILIDSLTGIYNGFGGIMHGGGNTITLACDTNAYQSNPVFNALLKNAYIDSITISGDVKNYTTFVYGNYGTIKDCVCDVNLILDTSNYGSFDYLFFWA